MIFVKQTGSFLESNVGSSSIHLLAPAPADEETSSPDKVINYFLIKSAIF